MVEPALSSIQRMNSASENPQNSFQELLRCAKNGDADSIERLFARVADEDQEGKLVLAMARKILPAGDRARDFVESRDLIQSALRSGWLHIDNFRGTTQGEFMSWLRAILRHRLGRVVRRKNVSEEARNLPDIDDAAIAAEETDPIARIVREEVHDRIRESVAQLPDEQRAVLELRLQGLNAPKIGAVLCLRPDTVRKRESRAVIRLRELLDAMD